MDEKALEIFKVIAFRPITKVGQAKGSAAKAVRPVAQARQETSFQTDTPTETQTERVRAVGEIRVSGRLKREAR